MEPDELAIKELTNSVLKNFVCELARDQEVVKIACHEWFQIMYEAIVNIQNIGKQ